MNCVYVTKEITDEELIQGRYKKIKTSMIGVKAIIGDGKKLEQVYPSPYSMFITHLQNKGNSLNTQGSASAKLIVFLNFLTEEARKVNPEFLSYREKGVFGLTRVHGAKFITHLTYKGSAINTVQNYEWVLNQFYKYLTDMEWIEEKIVFGYKDDGSWHSIFKDAKLKARYPSKDTVSKRLPKRKDFGKDRYRLIVHFLQIARSVAPQIAFAICLQFYGGLRRGEVVNLTRREINAVKGESLSVQIRDNRSLLFSRLRDTKAEFPKRLSYLGTDLANQTILDNDLLWEIYQEHEEMLESLRGKGKIKNVYAYFVDSFGEAMSGKVYNKHFNRVKKVFLYGDKDHEGLAGHKDYTFFTRSYWSSHIGRGVFTNFLLDMGLSITQISIARGDRSTSAVMEYVDDQLTSEALTKAIEELKSTPVEKMGVIDRDLLKVHWKDGVLKRERKNRWYR